MNRVFLFTAGAILVLFEVFTGFFLYTQKYGFSVNGIKQYIHGNPELFIQPKTIYGLIEVHFPHFFVVFLTAFVLMHFFYFFRLGKIHFFTAVAVFLLAFANFSSVFIVFFWKELAVFKLISAVLFNISFIFTAIFLVFTILKKHLTGTATDKLR
ncbi:hypothetical protein [Persephonella sp.]